MEQNRISKLVKVNMMQNPAALKRMDKYMARRSHDNIGKAVEALLQGCNISLCPSVGESKNCSFYILEEFKLLLDSVPHRLGFGSRDLVIDFLVACRDVFDDDVDLDLSSWHSLLTTLKASVTSTATAISVKRQSDTIAEEPSLKKRREVHASEIDETKANTQKFDILEPCPPAIVSEDPAEELNEIEPLNIVPIKEEAEVDPFLQELEVDQLQSYQANFEVNSASASVDTMDDIDFDGEDETEAKNAASTNTQTKWAAKLFKEWLESTGRDTEFENLSEKALADLLCELYTVAQSRNGKAYGKTSMINIRSGLNRYLTQPPFNRKLNLMHDSIFLSANRILKKRFLRTKSSTKQESLEAFKRLAMSKEDLSKMLDNYFLPNMYWNPEVLQQKVFFDLCFYLGKLAREGFRDLTIDSFEVGVNESGKEYFKVHPTRFRNAAERDDRIWMVFAQDSPRCPVKSFKFYYEKINKDVMHFFQRPNRLMKNPLKDRWYDKPAVGKNTLGIFMKNISRDAGLSQEYPNHCIRATALVVKDVQKTDHIDYTSYVESYLSKETQSVRTFRIVKLNPQELMAKQKRTPVLIAPKRTPAASHASGVSDTPETNIKIEPESIMSIQTIAPGPVLPKP